MLARNSQITGICLLLALLVLLIAPRQSPALDFRPNSRKPLSLELEWRFADYTSDSSTNEDFDASHFVQKYSALYKMGGNVYHGKGGSYALGLGLEWWSIDSTFGDEDISLSNFKPLYNGELFLAPRGLPFRLHLFAYDKDSANFYTSDYREGILNSSIITDVNDGESHTFGGTLVAGIKNGSYAGEFREHLSQFPKLYIDFRQDFVRDLESNTPEHYRDRNLAFVSLNKKDNWFHYRLHDFEDYLDNRNNFSEKSFLLGTIDHLRYRQWIWLTNWVKLSTDGSFTINDEPYRHPDPEEIFDYNLFFVGKKNRLTFSNLNSFSRSRYSDLLNKELNVPVYLSYAISPDRQAHVQMLLEREERTYEFFPGSDAATDNVYLSGKLTTGMTQPIRFDPELELEFKEGTLGRGQSARGSVELYTNPAYRPANEWLVAYSLGSYRGTPYGNDREDVSFLEHVAEVSLSHQATPTLRVGGGEKLVIGRGEIDNSVSKHIQPESDDGWLEEDGESGEPLADTLRSVTELFIDHRRGKLANRFLAVFDYLKVNDQDDQQSLELSHRLNYDNGSFRLRMINELELGDQVGERGFLANRIGVASAPVEDTDVTFESETFASYLPNQIWSVDGRLGYIWRGGGTESHLLDFRQTAKYNFFHVNGKKRRWLEFQQEFELEKSWGDAAWLERTYGNFTLGSRFYPAYNTYLRGNIGYEWHDPGMTIVTYGLGIGLDFPLFKVEASYEYGIGDDNDSDEDVTEHRWELNIKKLI